MRTFVFDLDGTLRNNPGLTDEAIEALLVQLRVEGHKLAIWTASDARDVPASLRLLVDEVWSKDGTMTVWGALTGMVVYVDDCPVMRRTVTRFAKRGQSAMDLHVVDAKDLATLSA